MVVVGCGDWYCGRGRGYKYSLGVSYGSVVVMCGYELYTAGRL